MSPPPELPAPKVPDNKRIQMSDVARLAGVSLATVSRALSGSTAVREPTRKRIVELARSLDYTVNVSAQNLRSGAHPTIAVIIPYAQASRQHVTDPFFLAMLGSLGDALTEQGYDMLLSRIDSERLEEAGDWVRSGRAKGLIVIGQSGHHRQLNALAIKRIPLVVWGAQLSQQMYVSVGGDNFSGGKIATKRLLDTGCRHIAFLGDPALPEVELRYQGYVTAHRELGLQPGSQLLVPTPFLADSARLAMRNFLSRQITFDAVFAASDLLAIHCAHALKDAAMPIPDKVRLIGYDDLESAAHFSPPLTTIRQPIIEAGQVIVHALNLQIAGESAASVVLPTTLTLRQSA